MLGLCRPVSKDCHLAIFNTLTQEKQTKQENNAF
jgi:hypothetical protein